MTKAARHSPRSHRLEKFNCRMPVELLTELRTVSVVRKAAGAEPGFLEDIVTEAVKQWLARNRRRKAS